MGIASGQSFKVRSGDTVIRDGDTGCYTVHIYMEKLFSIFYFDSEKHFLEVQVFTYSKLFSRADLITISS